MKKAKYLVFLVFALLFTFSISSCNSNKTGCPINENVHTKTDKKGNLSTRRGKSSLFPKNMSKKKKKR